MAAILCEFRVPANATGLAAPEKCYKLAINFCSDDCCGNMNHGDQIGFDLAESDDYFYITVSRKVFINKKLSSELGDHILYIVTLPVSFGSIEEVEKLLEKFKQYFGDRLDIR